AHNYIGGGVRNIFSITRDIDFRLEGYIFKPFREFEAGEDAGVVLSNDLTKLYFTGTAATVYHSPLGPIGLQVNYYDDSENQLGVLLHVGYVLFNKRALE
ncbi:MAG: patatin, partial [Cyclobacteriaceae bacterium]|nr:patatin [Cyclobacteriaceae bacterium]